MHWADCTAFTCKMMTNITCITKYHNNMYSCESGDANTIREDAISHTTSEDTSAADIAPTPSSLAASPPGETTPTVRTTRARERYVAGGGR